MFGMRPGMFGGPSGSPPMWELIEKKSGTGASGRISFTGLDGDTDKFYKAIGFLVPGSSVDIRWEFNGATTSMGSRVWGENGTLWQTDGSTASTMLMAFQTSPLQLRTILYAGTSSNDRIARSNLDGASTNIDINTSHNTLENTTNITSIDLVVSTGNWATTTHVWLYKLTAPVG